jgi:hypothetical protein
VLNSQWLDIATGVVLVWFLFALAVSAVNEGLAKIMAVRSKQLWAALRQLLDGTEKPQGILRNLVGLPRQGRPSSPYPAANAPVSARLYATQTVQSLEIRGKATQKTRIENIPASVFSHAMIELALTGSDTGAGGADDPINTIDAYIAGLPAGPLKAQLQAVVTAAGRDITSFRDGLESWFNGQMTRLSRLYRAQVHIILAVIGMVIAVGSFGFGLQSNSFELVSQLQHDQNLRTVLVGAASQTVRGDLGKAAGCDPTTDPNPAACQLRGVSSLDKIDFVLHGNVPPNNASLGQRLGFLLPWRHLSAALGVIVTGIAISFGSSFWFALLKKLVGMRSSN